MAPSPLPASAKQSTTGQRLPPQSASRHGLCTPTPASPSNSPTLAATWFTNVFSLNEQMRPWPVTWTLRDHPPRWPRNDTELGSAHSMLVSLDSLGHGVGLSAFVEQAREL